MLIFIRKTNPNAVFMFSAEIKPLLKCLGTNSGAEDIDNIPKSL